MQVLQDCAQGSNAWHAARAGRFGASEASAAAGLGKYMTRDQLLHQKATGITEEVTPAKQRIFDAGHAAEAAAREHAERIAGVEFSPLVGTADIEGLPLLASFDGIDLMGEVIWENKLLSQSLVSQVKSGALDPHYWYQLEHQLLVSGAKRALFTTSDGTEAGTHECWYESQPERRAQVISAWKQFQKDLAAYVPPDAPVAKVVAESVTTLPAVSSRVTGDLAVKHNLPAFELAWKDFVANKLVRDPETDLDFANLEQQVKAMEAAEAGLDAAEESALSETEVLSQFIVMKRALREMVCEQRKASKKQMTEKKESIKQAQVLRGQSAFSGHMASLNASLGKPYMPVIATDFPGAIKGKRTVDSLRGAVNDELARAKIAADEVARTIQTNLNTLREKAKDHTFLFADTAALVLKDAEFVAMTITTRIAEHAAAEAKRLENERAKIRAEEAAKLQKAAEDASRVAAAESLRLSEQAIERAVETPAVPNPSVETVFAQHFPGVRRMPIEMLDSDVAYVPVQKEDDGERLNLTAINEHISPLAITAAGLAQLGFDPAATVKASRLYRACDLPAIVAALVEHLNSLELQPA